MELTTRSLSILHSLGRFGMGGGGLLAKEGDSQGIFAEEITKNIAQTNVGESPMLLHAIIYFTHFSTWVALKSWDLGFSFQAVLLWRNKKCQYSVNVFKVNTLLISFTWLEVTLVCATSGRRKVQPHRSRFPDQTGEEGFFPAEQCSVQVQPPDRPGWYRGVCNAGFLKRLCVQCPSYS